MKFLTNHLKKFEEYIICITFPIMVILVVLATAVRYFQIGSIPWAEEAARYLMIAMVFAGIALGFRDNTHLGMSFIVNSLPESMQKIMIWIRTVLIIAFSILTGYFTLEIIKKQMQFPQASPSMHIPMWIVYSIMLVGSVLMVIRTIQAALCPMKDNNNASEGGC